MHKGWHGTRVVFKDSQLDDKHRIDDYIFRKRSSDTKEGAISGWAGHRDWVGKRQDRKP